MTKCPVCGAIARREDESGDGIIFLKCSNNHTFERKLKPLQWRAETLRRMFESPEVLKKRRERLRKRREGKKGENEVFLDCRTLYL